MKIHDGEVAKAGAELDLGGIAGHPGPGDTLLHDVDGAGHHPPHARGTGLALAPAEPLAEEAARGGLVRFVRPGLVQVGVEVDGDHHLGPHGAGQRDGHGVDHGAIHQPAVVDPGRGQNAGHAAGGAHALAQGALLQPDLAAGIELGGDAGEGERQALHGGIPQMGCGDAEHLVTAEQAAGEGGIEQPHHLQAVEAAYPALQLVQFTGGIGGADEAADGAARHQIRLDAEALQRPYDADVRPSSGGAAAQGQAQAGFS